MDEVKWLAKELSLTSWPAGSQMGAMEGPHSPASGSDSDGVRGTSERDAEGMRRGVLQGIGKTKSAISRSARVHTERQAGVLAESATNVPAAASQAIRNSFPWYSPAAMQLAMTGWAEHANLPPSILA